MLCWTAFHWEFYTLTLLPVSSKTKPFPWRMRHKQKGGRRRPSPFQPTKHSFAIQPLLPFQMQNEWSTTAIYREPSQAFSFEKKSFISFPGPGSRDKPEIKKQGVLLISATAGSSKEKTLFFLHFISEDLSPPHSSWQKERAFLLPGSLRNHRRTFTLSLHELVWE